MERMNPHFLISKPTYYLEKPKDCKYYHNGYCYGQKSAPSCNNEGCKIYSTIYKPQIITLCGSTRFKDYFFEAARDLTLQGWIVLMPNVFGHSGDEITEKEKRNLDKLHLEKIRLSDAIFVLNIRGYIGESTQKEIEFARFHEIPIYKYE